MLSSIAGPQFNYGIKSSLKTQVFFAAVGLRGVKTNRDGVGARVKVVAGDLTLYDEVHSSRGYQSHYGTRLHFGLGAREKVDRIEVRWNGGAVDVFKGI